ncbi:hypothetical protein NDU88_002729 [Pleurodeles waltl]|uniref:Uncharacterized protein n=1 Tax=Pleurodeles waltl TaxID=8319 RepID=A0AAV7M2E9_PLEWA|nr:hypothetical protein NDU88_002729 [Pleurodeles waltl]
MGWRMLNDGVGRGRAERQIGEWQKGTRGRETGAGTPRGQNVTEGGHRNYRRQTQTMIGELETGHYGRRGEDARGRIGHIHLTQPWQEAPERDPYLPPPDSRASKPDTLLLLSRLSPTSMREGTGDTGNAGLMLIDRGGVVPGGSLRLCFSVNPAIG